MSTVLKIRSKLHISKTPNTKFCILTLIALSYLMDQLKIKRKNNLKNIDVQVKMFFENIFGIVS